jgi:hypothetical protein
VAVSEPAPGAVVARNGQVFHVIADYFLLPPTGPSSVRLPGFRCGGSDFFSG